MLFSSLKDGYLDYFHSVLLAPSPSSPNLENQEMSSEDESGDSSDLGPGEIWWRDHQQWLQRNGYILRPRYRPGWVPSWTGKSAYYSISCEDAIPARFARLIDATRIADGKIVMLKRINDTTHPYELEVVRLLSSEPLVSHPRNHTVPLYDVLDIPGEEHGHIIVMPLLRALDRPRFQTVGESVEFFHQIFEALQFLHQNHVAHRDCMDKNIMMDPVPLMPKLFHPQSTIRSLDGKKFAKSRTRTGRPTKYYVIDFGLSAVYHPSRGPQVDTPVGGGDRTVPEFQNSDGTPHEVFPTDVYYIGSMIRKCFLQRFDGLEFMGPLIKDMVQDDPKRRPTMDEVVKRFADIRRKLSWWTLRSRLYEKDETRRVRVYRSTRHVFRTIGYLATFRSAVPSP